MIGAALAALVFSRQASAQSWDDVPPDPPDPFPDFPNYVPSEPVIVEIDLPSDPVRALLKTIRYGEHSAAMVDSGNDYREFYGGSLFSDFADHPCITGEKQRVQLPDWMAANLGMQPPVYSTAAGAYQINVPTWKQFRQSGSWGPYLPDFSPAAQDEAARRILLSIGALSALDAGDPAQAIELAGSRWASLPGSSAGQRPKSMEWALATFNDALTVG